MVDLYFDHTEYVIERLGPYLKNARQRKGMTAYEVADCMGWTGNSRTNRVYVYESGKQVPSVKTLVKLLLLYGVSLDPLMRGTDD